MLCSLVVGTGGVAVLVAVHDGHVPADVEHGLGQLTGAGGVLGQVHLEVPPPAVILEPLDAHVDGPVVPVSFLPIGQIVPEMYPFLTIP